MAGHGFSTFLLPVLPFPREPRPRICLQGPRTLPGTCLEILVPVLRLSLRYQGGLRLHCLCVLAKEDSGLCVCVLCDVGVWPAEAVMGTTRVFTHRSKDCGPYSSHEKRSERHLVGTHLSIT